MCRSLYCTEIWTITKMDVNEILKLDKRKTEAFET